MTFNFQLSCLNSRDIDISSLSLEWWALMKLARDKTAKDEKIGLSKDNMGVILELLELDEDIFVILYNILYYNRWILSVKTNNLMVFALDSKNKTIDETFFLDKLDFRHIVAKNCKVK